MLFYITRRLIYIVIVMLIMSMIAFAVIQLPPGDFLTYYIAQQQQSGQEVDEAEIQTLKNRYGLDRPVYMQYFKWLGRMLRGDFGMSFQWNRPVKTLIGERLALTLVISIFTIVFTYLVAIPIGIYSATHQYSWLDNFFTLIGFSGLAIPNFLFALVLMVLFYNLFGASVGGLFSPAYETAAWSFAKVIDMFKHLPIPIIVVGTAGTASLIRVMRGCLLDELKQQYVITARAKGVKEQSLLFKYPVRIALNPIISSISWVLPQIISGGTITAIVLSLPTTGPLLLNSLMSEDMYLAGTLVMFLCFLTVIGTLISDIMLAVIDPRIRFEKS